MPVLSPHRSSASSTLSGSYRTTYSSSSSIDRPYLSTYSPRISSSSYSSSERFRSYTDSDGRRIFSRSGSVTEDGLTTRYREESRRESALSEYGGGGSRRDSSSQSRDSSVSRVNVLDSVAELRSKYSPSNYVPACLRERNNDNITRSKSINDIGLPPIELKINRKKVNELNFNNLAGSNGVLHNSNHTNYDNNKKLSDINDDEDDGNNNRASVADLRKKFDKSNNDDGLPEDHEDNSTVSVAKKLAKTNGSCRKSTSVANTTKATKTKEAAAGAATKLSKNDISRLDVKNCGEKNDNSCSGGSCSGAGSEIKQRNLASSRVNNFASYIPSKDYQHKETEITVVSEQEPETKRNELSSSPKLAPSVSPSGTGSSTNSLSRRSSERDRVVGNNFNETSHSSSASPAKQLGLNGLKNIGNTCFMNSVIQCLSNTKPLLEYLLKDAYSTDINANSSSMKGALIRAFVEVIKEIWSEDAADRVVNTASLKSQIQRFAPRFIGYAQQDAQEFLRYLLEGLHEDVNRVKERPKPILTEIEERLSDAEKSAESWSRYLRMDNSRIVDCFVGQLKSTLRCTHCGHCSVTFDPFWDLSLPIPQQRAGQQVRLSQCLESFTREETLDGDEKPTCSKCKERRRCTKSFTIQKFPKILVIHLKRFSLAERFRGKLSVTVDFPLEGLDMSHYAADGAAACRYNLYAISNHSGTTYSGHYTAYCRHPYTKSWHEYNDSRVSSISAKSIVSGEAYVLFYEQDGQKSHL